MMSRILVAAGLLCFQASAESAADIAKQLQDLKGGSAAAAADSSGHSSDSGSDDSKSQSSGDYQKYMSQYAGGSSGGGDYQKYYQQYMNGGGQSGGSGGYQKYMDQYASKYTGGQGGGYQKYMNEYASKYTGGQGGGYQQYMKEYASKYTGGQGGDYQQYMDKYAGGQEAHHASTSMNLIEEAPKESSDGSQVNLDSTSSGSQGNYQQYMQGGSSGGYQKYMKQYADKYAGQYMKEYASKYTGGQGGSSSYGGQDASVNLMEESSDGSQVNLDSTSSGSQGNYQQYMNQYAGGQGGSSGGYQKYMKQYADKYAGQYMNKYAGKYTGGHNQGGSESGADFQQSGGQGDSYQQYLQSSTDGTSDDTSSDDAAPLELAEKPEESLAKKSSDSHARRLQELGTSGLQKELQQLQGHLSAKKKTEVESTDSQASSQGNSKGNYQQYMNQYAGGQGGGADYMKQYAGQYAAQYEKYGDYQKYMKNNYHNEEIGSPKDCNTKVCLDKWYEGATGNVKTYVPGEYSKYADKTLDKQYEQRLAELENPSTTNSPLETVNLDEENTPAAKSEVQKSAKSFMAKYHASAKATEAEKLRLQIAANLQMYADDVKANPAECVGMCLLGASFSALVFFAFFHRRNIQIHTTMLG